MLLCLSGIGHDRALHAAALLIKQGAEALVSWGVAGGLNEGLHSGDIIIADKIISNDNEYPCSAHWQEQCLIHLSSDSYRIVSSSIYSDEIICSSPRDKVKLHQQSGADAVDMESAAIAGLAKEMELDFIAIRTICDEAIAAIPAAVIKHTDHLGKPKPISFVLSCIFNPAQIPSLLILARAFKKAINTMKLIAPDLKDRHFLYNMQP